VKVLMVSYRYPSPRVERHFFAREQIPALRGLPALMAGSYGPLHAHQALPDGALAQRLAADRGVPLVVTVHGSDVHQHFRTGGGDRRGRPRHRPRSQLATQRPPDAPGARGVLEAP